MEFRLAKEADIDAICEFVESAILEMEQQGIFQWDNSYPTKNDYLMDVKKSQLFVGEADSDILVVFTVNQECDEQYQNGSWKYPKCEYRVIHRLCVNPKFQHRGIAKKTLRHIENELRKIGAEAIRLDVFTGNSYALSLYYGSGYQRVGLAKWRKGEFALMEKHL